MLKRLVKELGLAVGRYDMREAARINSEIIIALETYERAC